MTKKNGHERSIQFCPYCNSGALHWFRSPGAFCDWFQIRCMKCGRASDLFAASVACAQDQWRERVRLYRASARLNAAAA